MTPVSIQEHILADPASGPYAITTGPDGAPWAALKIGALAQITIAAPPATPVALTGFNAAAE